MLRRFFIAICGMALLSASAPVLGGVRPKDSNAIFEFHSGFWINLHHFLYEQALSRKPDSECSEDKAKSAPDWAAALLFYKQNMVSRDLLFDNGMVAIKNSLEDQEHASSLIPTAGLSSPLIAALEKAAPTYRANCWRLQNQANENWIRQVSPLVSQYGEQLTRELSSAYQAPWPTRPIRVDVTNYASWSGAYTATEPTRITISSTDPRNQGVAALESLFHEASHGIIRHLQQAIPDECKKQDVLLPRRDLWHAVIFYTTGEVIHRRFPEYVPYAFKNGLWKRVWPMYIGPLERDWKPYLDGKTSFDAAVTALVKDVGEPKK